MTSLVVIGQGYVGLPMSLSAAAAGIKVHGLDTDADTVRKLNEGVSHIGDVSDQELAAGIADGFVATTDPSVISQTDVVIVCVPTPLADEGGPDLTAVRDAAATIGRYVQSGTLVILESTTYPGTTEEVFAPLVLGESYRAGTDIHIAFSPERIDPGNKQYKVWNTPKVVGGMTPECTRAAAAFYARFVQTVVPAKGVREAEMSKLLENTFRHVNIALVNEMLRFSDDLGIDLWNAIDCAETKPFGFMAFRPGPGVGGHCIPVDPTYLSHRVRARLGYSFRMVELAEEINAAAPTYVVDRLLRLLNERKLAMNGATVLLLGVTYKPDVADVRESPAVPIARQLLALGANLDYHDPFIAPWDVPSGTGRLRFDSVEDPYDAAVAADAVILLQPHQCYDLDRLARHTTLILDTRGILEETDVIRSL